MLAGGRVASCSGCDRYGNGHRSFAVGFLYNFFGAGFTGAGFLGIRCPDGSALTFEGGSLASTLFSSELNIAGNDASILDDVLISCRYRNACLPTELELAVHTYPEIFGQYRVSGVVNEKLANFASTVKLHSERRFAELTVNEHLNGDHHHHDV
ncbi:hypothetical protein RUND412_009785 [Rhizina undulata]